MKTYSINNFLIILLVIMSACTRETSDAIQEVNLGENEILITEEQFNRGNMKLGPVRIMTFSERVRASGMIDVPPQNRAEITAIMGGYVRKIALLVGSNVKQGDLLAVLENPEYIILQQEYLETKGQLAFLESEYQRQKKLYDERISSEKNYLRAESEFKRALATVGGLKTRLQMIGISADRLSSEELSPVVNLRSPISGTVTKVNASLGSFVEPADVIMEIVNPEHKHLELNVYEKDAMNLQAGQEISYRVPETSSEIFTSTVILIGKSVDTKSRTINIHGHLNEEDEPRFTVGMFVEAEIIREKEEFAALPETAVMGTSNPFILILDRREGSNLIFRKLTVETGESQNGFVPLYDFSDSTARILLSGGFSIAEQSE